MEICGFIDKDKKYDSEEIFSALEGIPKLIEKNISCSDRIQHLTGDIFRTEEDRQRFAAAAAGISGFKGSYSILLEKFRIGNKTLRQTVDILVPAANAMKEGHDNTMLRTVLRDIDIPEKEHGPMVLKAGRGIDAMVDCHNIFLYDLHLTLMELKRLESHDDKDRKYYLWWHTGQRISLPYAVAGLMLGTFIKKQYIGINQAVRLILGYNTRDWKDAPLLFEDTVNGRLTDIREVYSSFTGEKIENAAKLFKLKYLELPDEDEIMESLRIRTVLAEGRHEYGEL